MTIEDKKGETPTGWTIQPITKTTTNNGSSSQKKYTAPIEKAFVDAMYIDDMWIFYHESLHPMGLSDRYTKDNKIGFTFPDNGFQADVMGSVHSQKINQVHVNNIANWIFKKNSCKFDPVTAEKQTNTYYIRSFIDINKNGDKIGEAIKK